MDIELSGEKVEIFDMELQRYKRIERDYIRIDNDLTEYMGFSDEHLRSDKWLMKYNKKDLVAKIHEQRSVIRKLIYELDEDKRENYLSKLSVIEQKE